MEINGWTKQFSEQDSQRKIFPRTSWILNQGMVQVLFGVAIVAHERLLKGELDDISKKKKYVLTKLVKKIIKKTSRVIFLR